MPAKPDHDDEWDPADFDHVSAGEAPPGPSLIERLLDPRGIRVLMGSGGGLLVAGLVIWLWAVGVFENPVVTATTLGASNLALLAAGVWLGRGTRYETAGRGIALLAAAVMPLNLWFYDAQGLISLGEGGQLWIPATMICAVYAVSGTLLRDPNFAYAIVGGASMTGLLILADQRVDRFYEVVAPSALLTAVGLIAIHAERAFADIDGPFGRKRFGRAFFHAGQVALTSGLLVLLGGRVSGLLAGRDFFISLPWEFVPTDVATVTSLKWAALGLISAGAYGFAYSHAAADRSGRSLTLSILCLTWAALVGVDILNINLTAHLTLGLLAAAGFATVAASVRLDRGRGRDGKKDKKPSAVRPVGDGLIVLAGLGTVLLTLNRITDGATAFGHVVFLGGMTAATLSAAAWATGGTRRGHVAMAVLQGLCAAAVVQINSPLTGPQKFELGCVLAGAVSLVAAHIGWRREQTGRRDGVVTLGLWAGSLLVAAPLLIGLLGVRIGVADPGSVWSIAHEPVALAVALGLLAAGTLCRIRVTTFAGASMTAVYVLTLVCYLDVPDRLQNVATYLIAGGAVLFGGGITLSVYRERLLAIPGRLKNREGLFGILEWR
ncbi:MAG: hypothetical protein AAGJ97_02265 [Planctomycetota bacterium]